MKRAARLWASGFPYPAVVTAGIALEINARHTMCFTALAVERSLKASGPVFRSIE